MPIEQAQPCKLGCSWVRESSLASANLQQGLCACLLDCCCTQERQQRLQEAEQRYQSQQAEVKDMEAHIARQQQQLAAAQQEKQAAAASQQQEEQQLNAEWSQLREEMARRERQKRG